MLQFSLCSRSFHRIFMGFFNWNSPTSLRIFIRVSEETFCRSKPYSYPQLSQKWQADNKGKQESKICPHFLTLHQAVSWRQACRQGPNWLRRLWQSFSLSWCVRLVNSLMGSSSLSQHVGMVCAEPMEKAAWKLPDWYDARYSWFGTGESCFSMPFLSQAWNFHSHSFQGPARKLWRECPDEFVSNTGQNRSGLPTTIASLSGEKREEPTKACTKDSNIYGEFWTKSRSLSLKNGRKVSEMSSINTSLLYAKIVVSSWASRTHLQIRFSGLTFIWRSCKNFCSSSNLW